MSGSKSFSVGRLSIEMVADTVQYVNKLKEAETKTGSSLNKMIGQYDKTGKASKAMGAKMNSLSDQLKSMSQSAALVTGPLGGIASRFSILSSVVGAGPLVMGVVGLSTALAGMYKILKTGVMVTDQTLVQLSQLDSQLKLNNGSIGLTVNQLDAFARELGYSTLTSTVEVRKAMSLLATTTDLTGDSFLRTTSLAQDIAQVGMGDITSNAKMLAKALEDPVDGLSKLERLQIKFTDSQKLQIETLMEANKSFEAHALILDVVEKKYGNIAKNINVDTIASQSDTLAQSWEQLTEQFGNIVQPFVVEYLKDVDNAIKSITNTLNDEFQFKLDVEGSVAQDLKKQFGSMEDIAKNGSFAELDKSLTESILNQQKFIKQQKALNHELSVVEKFDWVDVQRTLRAIGKDKSLEQIGDMDWDVNQWKDYFTKYEENLRRMVITENVTQEQIVALRNGAYETNVRQADKQIELDKEVAANQLKEQQKVWAKLADPTKMSGIDPKYLEESAKKAQDALEKAFTMGDTVSFDELLFNQDAQDEINKRFEDFYAQYLQLQSDMETAAIKAQVERIQSQKALELEATNDMMSAKNQLLVNKYAEDLENYKTLVKGKADEDARLAEYQQAAASKLGQDLFSQNMAAREKETQWLTSNLDSAMDAMSALGKEGSGVAKAMFVANQAIAFGNAIVSANSAAAAARSQALLSGQPLPFAESAATAALMSGMMNAATIAATTIGGIAHGGLDSVPTESTYLLQKGERVVQPKANKDLTSFLRSGGSDSSGNVSISAPLTVQGNVTDEKWFASLLYQHRQDIASMNRKAKREKPRRG